MFEPGQAGTLPRRKENHPEKIMKCDINPAHGEMQEEPMFGAGMVIVQYGWFCQVDGCDGYGGPVEKKTVKHPTVRSENQPVLFE